jgi:diguanylate cyclase (GGDEF)-like protein
MKSIIILITMETTLRPPPAPHRDVLAVLEPTDPRLDCITELAVMATGTSIGGVSLIFQSQMWVPGRYGVGDAYLPRVGSFCNTALEVGEDWFEVADAADDPRFQDNPVVSSARLRHYAAVLLRGVGGHLFGTLWVMGKDVRTLPPEQAVQLRLLAEVAAETLNARYCDDATGLYKREVFAHHLQCLLDHAEDDGELTVGYVDLIGFRQLNESVGRTQGDAILRLIGERLVAWGGLYGLTGHLGGDRFAFAMDAEVQDSAARIDALRHVLDAPFDTASGPRRLHARIGIVRHPVGGVLAAANVADHAADQAGAPAPLGGAEAATRWGMRAVPA